MGIERQVITFTAPGTLIETPERSVELSRLVNDCLAAIMRDRPSRFSSLATLPLNDPEASVAGDDVILVFGLMTIGLFILRRRNVRGSYSAWGYPILPVIFITSSFAIVINQIIVDPRESSIGLGFVLLGLPVYYSREQCAK